MKPLFSLTVGVIAILTTSSGIARSLNWPNYMVDAIDAHSVGIQSDPAYRDYYLRNLGSTLAMATDQALPGAAMSRLFYDTYTDGHAALRAMDRGVARALSAGPDRTTEAGLQAAVALVQAAEALYRSGGLPPSAGAALAEAIDDAEAALAAAGGASLIETLLTSAAESTDRDQLQAFLDWARAVRAAAPDHAALAAADAEARQQLIDTVTGLLPEGYVGVLAGPLAAAGTLEQWKAELVTTSADGIEAIGEIIATGQVDHARLQRIYDRIDALRRGPWTGETVRRFIAGWCDELPISGAFCDWVLATWDEIADADSCTLAIDCDCANNTHPFPGIAFDECRRWEDELRNSCRAMGVVTGGCHATASGPAAYP